MLALKNIFSLSKTIKLQNVAVMSFSKDAWKDRDDAAEKVYITRS